MSDLPIRTFSMNHPTAGFIEFSIPVMNLDDVEAYLQRQTKDMEVGEAHLLVQDLISKATDMWNGYALWIGDPVQARLKLSKDKEIQQWLEVY